MYICVADVIFALCYSIRYQFNSGNIVHLQKDCAKNSCNMFSVGEISNLKIRTKRISEKGKLF